jgi:hypothetical protein
MHIISEVVTTWNFIILQILLEDYCNFFIKLNKSVLRTEAYKKL